jgi:hypothetical protein
MHAVHEFSLSVGEYCRLLSGRALLLEGRMQVFEWSAIYRNATLQDPKKARLAEQPIQV